MLNLALFIIKWMRHIKAAKIQLK